MPESPVASVHLWFEAGSADETPDIAGVAHFVEHMLFKGTARRGVGEAAGAIEAAGGDLNAWTSWDETCFHATLEAGEVREALDVVFDMTSASLLDKGELEREKQVVIEEIRGYDDDPDTVVADHLHTLLFGDHPYGKPVIGFPSTVTALDRAVVEGFWRTHYHPGRAILSVAGPLDLREIRAAIDPILARWPVGSARKAMPAAGLGGPGKIERLNRDFGSVVVQLGWPGPGVGHPDIPALDVLMTALGQGAASVLTVLLDLENGVASHTWADAQAWVGGGIIGAGFLCGETEDAIGLAVGELARVARTGLSGTLVARARDAILADLLFATETAEGVAADLAWNMARTGDPLADRVYAAAVGAVTPAMVRSVAERWLEPERLRLVVIDRDLQTRKLRSTVERARRAPVGTVRKSGDATEVTRVHGVRIVTLPDRSDIAAVQVLGIGGQLAEDADHAGISDAWARMVERGAGPYDATQIAERADALAVQLDASAGRSTFGLQASFPASNTDEALRLLGEILVDPHFAAEDWANVREEIRDAQAAQVDRPTTVAAETLWKLLWPEHPWRLPTLGNARSIARIGPRRLVAFHQLQVAADNLVIAVAGGIDPDRVIRTLEAHLAELPKRSAVPARPAPGPIEGTRSNRRAGNEQATVSCGVRGVAIGHPDRTALSVATHVLDSQSGRLFLELREQRGLAYGVWAQSENGVDGGVFSAGLSTDPSRVGEAIAALESELAKLAEHGPTEAELAKISRMIHGLAAMRHQRVAGRAYDLAWSTRFEQPYGLPSLKERLAAVTPATVQAALQKLGLDDPIRITVLPKQA